MQEHGRLQALYVFRLCRDKIPDAHYMTSIMEMFIVMLEVKNTFTSRLGCLLSITG